MTGEFSLPEPGYNADEGFWMCQAAGSEVNLRGGPGGVDPSSASLARRVLPGLAALAAEGQALLREFVDPARLRGGRGAGEVRGADDWLLVCADFGRRPDLRAAEFELLFTLREDVYGLWGVRFESDEVNAVCFPVEFRRQQW